MKTRFALILTLALLMLPMLSCQTATTGGKVLITPLTVVRDVVDAPLTSIANVFEDIADSIRPVKSGTGSNILSLGIVFYAVENAVYYTFKGFSGIFGGVDYLICRSLWPSWSSGLNPWRAPHKTWGDMYLPNTRVLWGDTRPIEGSLSRSYIDRKTLEEQEHRFEVHEDE